MTRAITLTLVIVSIAAAAIYLHDPPWVGDLTYGFRPWATDAHGRRYGFIVESVPATEVAA